jgi:hypothetical protein
MLSHWSFAFHAGDDGKIVDSYIRDEILGLYLLHQYQFAYQPGKSTETTWHIKFRRRGITQKEAYNIQNTAKV